MTDTSTQEEPVTTALARAALLADPRDLLIDANIRTDVRVDPDLVESIREIGVQQPITACRTGDGRIRVRYGHRRALAAIEAGLDLVPVFIIRDGDGDGDADRIIGQHAENTYRDSLTAADQAGVVTQLLDLGLTAGDITRRTRVPAAAIAAARAVRGSAAAAAAAARPGVTLDMAAGIAEFGADPEAARALTAAAEEGDGQFRQKIQRLRDDRDNQRQRDELTAGLEAAGVQVLGERPASENMLARLQNAKGRNLTPKNHAGCPGHAAWPGYQYDPAASTRAGRAVYEWAAEYFCTDPAAHGHLDLLGQPAAAAERDVEAERAGRARVREGNAAWRSAATVRREFLTGLLARKTAPKGAAKFIASSIASDTHSGAVRYCIERRHKLARAILGLPARVPSYRDPEPDALAMAIDRAGEARAQVISLALILAAFEEHASEDAWRHPGRNATTARYLDQLAAWGYTPSAIEQAVTSAHAASGHAAGTGDPAQDSAGAGEGGGQ
jgi:ParB family chromosome partitioning protein